MTRARAVWRVSACADAHSRCAARSAAPYLSMRATGDYATPPSLICARLSGRSGVGWTSRLVSFAVLQRLNTKHQIHSRRRDGDAAIRPSLSSETREEALRRAVRGPDQGLIPVRGRPRTAPVTARLSEFATCSPVQPVPSLGVMEGLLSLSEGPEPSVRLRLQLDPQSI